MTLILKDKIFISTRPVNDSDDLPALLTGKGAKVIEFPLIQIKIAEITEEEKKEFSEINSFNWIVFTSQNGVRHFFSHLKAITGSHHLDDSVQIATIGVKTEHILLSYGYHSSFVNPGSTAEDFSAPFLKHIEQENTKPKILLPVGKLARTVIQDHLKEAASCVRIDIYKTEFPDNIDQQVIRLIEDNYYDMIIFTSPSGIRNFMKVMSSIPKDEIRMACIGEITNREARNNGFNPLVTASKSSAAGMVESIINYYISKK